MPKSPERSKTSQITAARSTHIRPHSRETIEHDRPVSAGHIVDARVRQTHTQSERNCKATANSVITLRHPGVLLTQKTAKCGSSLSHSEVLLRLVGSVSSTTRPRPISKYSKGLLTRFGHRSHFLPRNTPPRMAVHVLTATDIILTILAIWLPILVWRRFTKVQARKPLVNRTVAIVVLGDIGRSPRMMYHAESFAKAGFDTTIVGYKGVGSSCSH